MESNHVDSNWGGIDVSWLLFIVPGTTGLVEGTIGIVEKMPGNESIKLAVESAGPHQIWPLLLSMISFLFGVFLVHRSATLREWMVPKAEKPPDLMGGVILAWLSVFMVAAVYSMHLTMEYGWERDVDLFIQVLKHPERFFPMFTIASILPTAIACVNFLMMGAFSTLEDSPKKSLLFPIGGFVIGVINFAGSVATLIGFYQTHAPG